MKARRSVAALWEETNARALQGGEDYRVMSASLLRLGRQLAPHYDVLAASEIRGRPEALSAGVLNARFQAVKVAAESAFLDRQRQAGKDFSSVEDFLEAARTTDDRTNRSNHLKLKAWHTFKGPMLEAMCLLCSLARFTPIARRQRIEIFETTGPIEVMLGDSPASIRTGQKLPNTKSGLRAHPDLLCTGVSSASAPPPIQWIVECKCNVTISSNALRAEFGKNWDLGSPSYTIVAFYAQSQKLMSAAKLFGIDLEIFPLSTERRDEYVARKRVLENDLADMLHKSRVDHGFARLLHEKGAELDAKLLLKR